MDTIIRKARAGDERGIHESHMRSIREVCIKDHGADEIKGWGNRPLGDLWDKAIRAGTVWVVEKDATIAGFGCIRIFEKDDSPKAHLHALYLTPEVLGQGFGRKLLDLMLSYAKARSVEIVTLESSITAHAFYQSYGFNDSGPSGKIDIGGHPVTYFPMTLSLSALSEY